MIPTKDQRDTWTALCQEATSVGLVLIHVPADCLCTAIPSLPDTQFVYLRYEDPAQAIKEAKHSIAFKRTYPDGAWSKERLTAFNAQYIP